MYVNVSLITAEVRPMSAINLPGGEEMDRVIRKWAAQVRPGNESIILVIHGPGEADPLIHVVKSDGESTPPTSGHYSSASPKVA